MSEEEEKEVEEQEEEQEEEQDGEEGGDDDGEGSYESTLADEDRDFDFEPENTAQKDLPDFLASGKDIVRCRYDGGSRTGDEEGGDGDGEPDGKRRKVDEDLCGKVMEQLQAATKTAERLQLVSSEGNAKPKYVSVHTSISKVIGECLLQQRLTVLRVDKFAGSGDPIFNTRHEVRRKYRAAEHDLFELLTRAFVSGGKCGLKKLTLQDGFMSAESLMKFLRVAKPPLESFRCRGCLFHGRNFEPLVKALKSSTTAPQGLLEFETNASVGGEDPWGLIADAFPNLKLLRAPRIFGKKPREAAVERLKGLEKKKCKFPQSNRKLRGNVAMGESGVVEFFISSDHHDDGYRGQGLFWDELENTMECMESWRLGKPVKKKEVIQFMAECGISLDKSIDMEEVEDDDMESSADEGAETIAAQLAVSPAGDDGKVCLKATTLSGREIGELTVEKAGTLVRTVVEVLAQKYPCSPLSLRLALPDSSTLDVMKNGSATLASVLK